jgi:thiamine biosynthesis lipoprotein
MRPIGMRTSKPDKLPKRQIIAGAVFVLALIAVWLMRSRETELKLLRINGMAYSTVFEIKVTAPEFAKDAKKELREQIDRELERVDEAMSRFRDDSEISLFNKSKGVEPFAVSKETAYVVDMARRVSELSGGTFDITVGPLIGLWGFYTKRGLDAEPTQEEIDKARLLVGYRALKIDLLRSTLQKTNPSLHLDLSAIAKGYAVDSIANAIERLGFENYLVEIGGEVRGRGLNDKARAWRIGIEKPTSEHREIFQVIELDNKSVATSGDYRNFYELNGKRMSHTIDPRTGRPISHQLASVSVVHDECAMADALATAFTVLGPKDGFSLAQKEGLPALFITREKDGRLADRATPAFSRVTVSRVNSASSGEKKDGKKW